MTPEQHMIQAHKEIETEQGISISAKERKEIIKRTIKTWERNIISLDKQTDKDILQ